ncbi:SDR family NAD(P)-dependent oxidoreductase [Streptomyces sp. NPDC127068]|uniref:SDR family NAD(P)-dependent oxidoreductase n=1 Tax=Streptomyces sp. NPDC127068 TaxID=3347127 RepID=UPI0036548E4D
MIAGGTSGLGLATARLLADGGHHLVLLSRDADRAAAALSTLPSGVRHVAGDARNPDDVESALEQAAELAPLWGCVNSVGVPLTMRVLSHGRVHPQDLFEECLLGNAATAFNLTRLVAAHLAGQPCPEDGERGVIVHTASTAALDGQTGQAAYAAAKAAVTGMTLPLARDLAAQRIRVVTIAPGLYDTPMAQEIPADTLSHLIGHVPHPQRLGRPEEFASLVVHVLNNQMINGAVIRADAAFRLPDPQRNSAAHRP